MSLYLEVPSLSFRGRACVLQRTTTRLLSFNFVYLASIYLVKYEQRLCSMLVGIQQHHLHFTMGDFDTKASYPNIFCEGHVDFSRM